MLVLLLCLHAAFAAKEIKDGDCLFIDSSVDPDLFFLYRPVPESRIAPFHLTVTLYSASQSLSICVRFAMGGVKCEYKGTSLEPFVVVPDADLRGKTNVYAMVMCGRPCRYRITAMRSTPIALKLNKPIYTVTDSLGTTQFRYKLRLSPSIVVTATGRSTPARVSISPSFAGKCVCFRLWDGGHVCELQGKSGDWVQGEVHVGGGELVKIVSAT